METGEHGQLPLPHIKGSTYSEGNAQARECAIITLDRAANVISWSAQAEQLFGYLASAAIGKPFYHFIDLESLVPGSVEWELSTAYYRGATVCSRQYTHHDGSRFRAATEIMPVWDGEFLGYQLTFSEVDSVDGQVA